MFCTPPATTRSCVPAITACAAKCTACWAEPHWRSMVVPGTCSGRPAASQQVRAMSPACGPTVSTLPKTTSSTAPGSMPVRSMSALIECAPRSAGWTVASRRRGARRACGRRRRCRPRPWWCSSSGVRSGVGLRCVVLRADDHGGAVAEQTLVGGDADRGALDLAAGRLAAELPHELAHLRDRLRGDRLAEAGEAAARVDGDAAADGGGAGSAAGPRPRPRRTGRCARTSRARARSRGRTPRPGSGPRADAGLLVGGARDRVLVARSGAGTTAVESVAMSGSSRTLCGYAA